MAKKTSQARLKLVANNGKRIDQSSDGPTSLHRHIVESELASTQGLDLPGPPFGNFAIPHADGFATDAERIGEGLMRTTEVSNDLLESDARRGHAVSVSTLPLRVKRLTTGARSKAGKLPYMQKKRAPRDEWAIQRGQAMKAARQALGLSQARVAEYAGIKDRETIAQYESGLIADIAPAAIPALSRALGLSPQQLSRAPWGARDDAGDLRVSPVAKQLAYRFDDYPLVLQNQIRAAIASYEALVKSHGKAQVDAMYTPPHAAGPPATDARSQKRKTG